MTAEANLPGPDLARVLNNALVFVPARSRVPYVRVSIGGGYVIATGTDSYTVGTDSAAAMTADSTTVYVERKDVQELEKAARLAKKEDVVLEVKRDVATDLHHIRLTVGDVYIGPFLTAKDEDADLVFKHVDVLMDRLDRQEPVALHTIAFGPDLFARFSKVRGERDHTMHVIPQARDKPALVRIGPTFRGAIMPIVPIEPEEGLW